jgi:hypothetical protein
MVYSQSFLLDPLFTRVAFRVLVIYHLNLLVHVPSCVNNVTYQVIANFLHSS